MHNRKLLVFVIIFLFFEISFSPIYSGNFNDYSSIKLEKQVEILDDNSFDRIITTLMNIARFPSLSACVIKNNDVVWARGYGSSDIENNISATENTIYMICSISKVITGTALMQLYDQGLFELDDDVNEYLPFQLRNPNFPDINITFRMLLSHSSSLIDLDSYSDELYNDYGDPPILGYPYPWIEDNLVEDGSNYDSNIWRKYVRPGALNYYGNINYDIIAYLVENLSGQPFHEYCTEHIFEPLNMTNTSFCLDDYDIKDIAIPYQYRDGDYIPVPHYKMLHYPVGGLRSSVMDLSYFLIAHINEGVYNGTRILKKETVEEMHKVQPPGNRDIVRGGGYNYGLAWMIFKLFGREIISGHAGDIKGYHTDMFMKSSDNTAVIYFVNGHRGSILSLIIVPIIREMLFLKAQ